MKKFRVACRIAALCGFALFAGTGIAWAQVGAGQIAPPSSPIERAVPERQPQAVSPLIVAPSTPTPAEVGPVVSVHAVEVEGATVYPPASLARFYRGIVDRPLPVGEISAILERIQTKYREDGYFLTLVRGAIEPANGASTLRIRVIEGFIASVKIDGDIGPAGVQVYRFLERLTRKRPTNIKDVERALLLSEDVPGVSVRAVLRPGSGDPGAVDLIAQVGRKPFSGLVQYDNRASLFAGPNELLVGAYANSFTSIGERSEVIIYDTPFNEEQVFGQAAVEGFVGGSGLKLRGYAGYGPSVPGGPLATIDYHSRLLLTGLAASYPIERSRLLTLSVSGAFDVSQSEVDVLGASGALQRQSNDYLRIVRIGETLNFQDDTAGLGRTGANLVALTLHKGLIGLGSSHTNDPLTPRIGSRVDFLKLSGEITRVQDLFDIYDYRFALKLSIGGQYTSDVLPPIEKYFLGGTRYGRGFFSGEVTGDRAIGTTSELQVNHTIVWPRPIGLQYYLFYDTGRTWDLAPGDINQHLASTGVGVRAQVTSQISLEVEDVERFTRRPTGQNVNPEGANVIFVGVTANF
ncbi:MAG TPA: ShlB/FhaC/HecB family hemolysin secretion/activation protein [Stellaceae bacterium]|nr:ShlB/FhaC/HecB family hemolysin secretion/activation protein [Stellaceae bacterium]